MFVNHPGESFQFLDFFAVYLDLFIKTSENAGSVVLLQLENLSFYKHRRIEKSPLKGYITEEGVSTGKSKNEQYQKFKF